MAVGRIGRRWDCPDCGGVLEFDPDADRALDSRRRMLCPDCGRRFRLRKVDPDEAIEALAGSAGGAHKADPQEADSGALLSIAEVSEAAPVLQQALDAELIGPWGLVGRDLGLRIVELAFRVGAVCGTTVLFTAGGFVPVVKSWLENELHGWRGLVERLGGAWPTGAPSNPDGDLGPVLARRDAPGIFNLVAEISRLVGTRTPSEVRLAYLPCCAVVAFRKHATLVIGLPLLEVLSIGELRAVLAHELTHLARGDAVRSSRAERFVFGLTQAIESTERKGGFPSPLWFWSRLCRSMAARLHSPIALGQEVRADRSAAAIAGGDATARSLIRVALVQPIFRELVNYHENTIGDPGANIYTLFRSVWRTLPEVLGESMKDRLLSDPNATSDAAHPPLATRLRIVGDFPDRTDWVGDRNPAINLLADPEAMEDLLHDRLFGSAKVEPSVFHAACR